MVTSALLIVAVAGATAGGSTGRRATSSSRISPTAVLIHPNEVYAGSVNTSGPPSTAQCEAQFQVACYTPAQIQQAYGLPALYANGITGAGRTIVIVDSY